jgi:hypothetical protein
MHLIRGQREWARLGTGSAIAAAVIPLGGMLGERRHSEQDRSDGSGASRVD